MITAIIPARFASTRLMGKPLADIGGKPMIQHTYESVKKSKLVKNVIVAVDDQKVYDTVVSFGGNAKITPKDIRSGSDRIAYVAETLPDSEIIVNVQGDEPFIPGRMIDEAVEPLVFDHSINISTLASRITTVDEFTSPAVVKVVFDYENNALYFSRAPVPHVRDASSDYERVKTGQVYKHIGLYVYRKKELMKFSSLEQTDLEKTEQLEQLRMLENGMDIRVVISNFNSLSVDTPSDLERARNFYANHIEQGFNLGL